MAQPDEEQIRAALEVHPQFKDGSAYVRTKLCCDVLTKLGHSIPSWIVLRQYIGKGSSGDISRGVKDFRAEHATLLEKISGMPEGIPDALAQPMTALWEAALAEAAEVFDRQRSEFHEKLAQAASTVAHAMAERDAKAGELAVATEKATGLQVLVEQEKDRANGERSAREQAERMAEAHITDLNHQRAELARVVQANTAELRVLNERLEEERRRSLREVEHARQQVALAREQALREGDQKTAKVEAALRKEMAAESLQQFQLQKRISAQESEIAVLRGMLSKERMRAPSKQHRAQKKTVATTRLRGLKKHKPI